MLQRLFWAIFILSSTISARAASEPPAVTYAQLNELLGIPLWASDNLWDSQAAATARRLKWRQESKTSRDSSYRLYTQPPVKVLGEHPYSLALYGDADGNVAYISMIFANQGDVQDLVKNRADLDKPAEQKRVTAELSTIIETESKNIKAQLTELLGKPRSTLFGQDANNAESVLRWDWNGHTILLSSEKGKYLGLRIVPSDTADRKSIKLTSEAAMRKQLDQRVVRRDNGDVVIQDIPMVNQGPKGYCVPATWERNLRYMGIPADMYRLAMLGSTKVGGGTSFTQMAGGVNSLIRGYGRHLVTQGGSMKIQTFSEKIDHGLPLMWGMFVVEQLNKDISQRSLARAAITDPADWAAYAKSLLPARKAAKNLKTDQDNGHMCMIIGYNSKTSEIAISDSWGPAFAERWITVEEAQAISQGLFAEVAW